MDLRGIVLIAFSALCLGVSGWAYQQKQLGDMGVRISNTVSGVSAGCRAGDVDTGFGKLRCIQRTSGFFNGSARGGARFVKH